MLCSLLIQVPENPLIGLTAEAEAGLSVSSSARVLARVSQPFLVEVGHEEVVWPGLDLTHICGASLSISTPALGRE